MPSEESNKPAQKKKEARKDVVEITEETAPVLLEDTAEANENDIELIDVSEKEKK